MSNNDNAMARFLFAILQQKCLKDIDWNKVAHSPVLTQEITNGHAARMRYSRFRAAMLGLEPQRRNRTNPDKSRVTKRKKGDGVKPKKEESGNGNDNIKSEGVAPNIKTERRGNTPPSQPPAPMMPTPAMVKTEPGLVHYSQHPHHHQQHHPSLLSSAAASPKIKEERVGMPVHASPMPEPSPFGIATTIPTPTLTPSSTTTAAFSDMHPRMQMRMLTPCSDSEIMQAFGPHSPSASDMLHHQAQAQAQVQAQAHAHAHQFSPAPSASASSPFDFAASPSQVQAVGGVSPWQSQHHQHQHQHHHTPHHHHHSQGYSVGFATAAGGGYNLDNGFAAFCGEHQQHQHQHQHQHQRHHEEVGDELGLHRATNMFRERELEMQMDGTVPSSLGGGGQGVKLEESWEAEGGYDRL